MDLNSVGQYFLGVGRINQIHHILAVYHTYDPSKRTFGSNEGIIDTGFEVAALLPFLST